MLDAVTPRMICKPAWTPGLGLGKSHPRIRPEVPELQSVKQFLPLIRNALEWKLLPLQFEGRKPFRYGVGEWLVIGKGSEPLYWEKTHLQRIARGFDF